MRTSITYFSLLACLFLSITPVFAQTFSPVKTIYQSPPINVNYLDASDLDGDGDLDFVAAARMQGRVYTFENDGAGHFEVKKLSDETLSSRITSCDLDGDGDLDLLSTIYLGLGWFENLGGMDFADLVVIDSVFFIGCSDAIPVDVDNDGDLDIFSSSRLAGEAYFYENLGGASFTPRTVVTSVLGSEADLTAADIDGDGDMDLLSATFSDNRIAWYENLGGTVFGPQQVITTAIFEPSAVLTADIDNDGDQDIAVGSSKEIAWLENLGGGLFTNHSLYVETISSFDIGFNVTLGDVDGDGNIDLLTSLADFKASWFRNLGAGSFTSAMGFSPSSAEMVVNHMVVGDFDGDGIRDIIGGGKDRIVLTENLTGLTFAPQELLSSFAGAQQSVVAGDFDGDGSTEVIGGMDRPECLVSYEYAGDGEFTEPVFLKMLPGRIESLRSADMDADGDPDVILLTKDLEIYWFENVGGTISDDKFIGATAHFSSLEVADMNQDGLIDILTGKTEWFENLGGGSFDALKTLGPNDYLIEEIMPADINGDGILDFITGRFNKLYWSEGLGAGTFTTRKTITWPLANVNNVVAADIDGDGDDDPIATLNTLSSIVVYFENIGFGSSFGSYTLIDSLAWADYLKAGDLDMDGDIDLIVQHDDEVLFYYENNGAGFYPPVDVTGPAPVNLRTEFELADVDDDGDLDILLGRSLDGYLRLRISWVENLTIDCETYSPVSDLSSTVSAAGVSLNWSQVDGAIGCQLEGTMIAPTTGPTLTRSFPGIELSSKSFPLTSFPPGSTWEARVRCLCSAPDHVTPFSSPTTFSFPLPRPAFEFSISPNPVGDYVQTNFTGQEPYMLRVLNIEGQTVYQTTQKQEQPRQSIDVSAWPTGVYFISISSESYAEELQFVKE